MMSRVGALVTLDLPEDSPALSLPWIITFGPISDEDEWEPVVCGPYEREHALSLAGSVVADEELMAVVEPLVPHTSVDGIRDDIAAAKLAAEETEDAETEDIELDVDLEEEFQGDDDEEDLEYDEESDEEDDEDFAEEGEYMEPTPPPSPDEIKAGFARIAQKLATS
jgi:hypothetical protein